MAAVTSVSISMAGMVLAGTAAALHGAAVWVGAACMAGTAGAMVRGNAVTAMVTGMVVITAMGTRTVAAIAVGLMPERPAAAALSTTGRAAAPRQARASRTIRAYEARVTCAGAAKGVCAVGARPAVAAPMCVVALTFVAVPRPRAAAAVPVRRWVAAQAVAPVSAAAVPVVPAAAPVAASADRALNNQTSRRVFARRLFCAF